MVRGKHANHGGNVQVITVPDGWPIWTSAVRPGREHDTTALRTHTEILPALSKAASDLRSLDDLGYEGEETLSVQGHPLLLREALNNLIDNALHYAGTGASVTVRVAREAGTAAADGSPRAATSALLVVEDDGPGVPPEHLGDLFARFWRGSDKPGGCGLGLSIVQEIALRHGGETVAEAVGMRGLRVGMRLPLP